MQEYFKIGEIAKLYGIGVDSLRYYEKIGILHPDRGESGYRHYSVQDIWKLNTIRDLRGLGFGMEQIREYLRDHTVDSTLALLDRENRAIGEKIRQLEKLRDNVRDRTENIRAARALELDTLRLKTCPPRPCCYIPEGYSDEYEMDVLIKRLLNMDKEHLYVIGSNQIGTSISLKQARETGEVRYQSVFVIDRKGEKVLPGGKYLTVSYRGDYQKTGRWVQKILQYSRDRGIRLRGDLLEILWIDIHTSSKVEEHITELQVLTEE